MIKSNLTCEFCGKQDDENDICEECRKEQSSGIPNLIIDDHDVSGLIEE